MAVTPHSNAEGDAGGVTTVDLSGVPDNALVFLVYGSGSFNENLATSAGWDSIQHYSATFSSGCMAKLFDGPVVDPTWTNGMRVAWIALIGAKSYEAGTADGEDTNIDPPSFTTAGSRLVKADSGMWVAYGADHSNQATGWAIASGYSNGDIAGGADGAYSIGSKVGTDSATENPGIVASNGDHWAAGTIAVFPKLGSITLVTV